VIKKIWFEQSDKTNPTPLQFQPASLHLPQWYSRMESYKSGGPDLEQGSISNGTVKRCIPFRDALSFGYVAVLHCDLFVNVISTNENEYGIEYQYAFEPPPIVVREYSANFSPTLDDSYAPIEMAWLVRWSINTEKNSSVLITHPLNRFDLPFTTSSGVIDSDSGFLTNVSAAPFYVRKGFSGVIPCGTPMFQVIPFERQAYKHEIRELTQLETYKRKHKWQKYFSGGYKREHHAKKRFT